MSFSNNQEEAKALIEEQGKLVKQFREEVVSEIKNQEDKVKTYVSEKDAKMQGRLDEIEGRINVLTGPDGRLKSEDSNKEELNDLYNKFIKKGFNKFEQQDVARFNELVKESYNVKAAGDPVVSGDASNPGPGGLLVPEQFYSVILNNFQEVDPMRQEADVIQISGTKIDFHTGFDAAAGWEAESFDYNAVTAPDAANPSFSKKQITAHPLMGQVRLSQEALEDIPNIGSYVTQRLATKMAYAEGNAYIDGNGSGKPQGINTTAILDQLSNNVTMGTNTQFDFDDFFELQGKFKSGYQNNLKWFFNYNTLGKLRKVQATGGEYLWAGALAGADGGHPATIAGRPYAIIPSLPNLEADSYSVFCGDMKQAYKIVQRVGVSVARLDEFQYPDILFIARTRVGGDLVLPEALGYMKGAA